MFNVSRRLGDNLKYSHSMLHKLLIPSSIDVKQITAIFFAISGIKIDQVSKKEETSSNQRKKLHLGRNVNLPRLLCASCYSKTSQMYSRMNVPCKIASPALTSHPCESDNNRQHKKPFESHCEFIKSKDFQFNANSVLQYSVWTGFIASSLIVTLEDNITFLKFYRAI